jgi:hypothetical protein
MSTKGLCVVLGVLGLNCAVWAEPYWIAWEGEAFPEEQGWERMYGDWEGEGHGGAHRRLHDGVLTYDSLHDLGVYDGSIMEPGQLDPAPGELFVMEWRLRVDEVLSSLHPYDPTVAVFSDAGRGVGFEFGYDELISVFENDAAVPIGPGQFHEYRLISADMFTYDLWIDDELARTGSFWQGVSKSRVAWGDGVQGAASLHQWDYFRFGVTTKKKTGPGPVPKSLQFTPVLPVKKG